MIHSPKKLEEGKDVEKGEWSRAGARSKTSKDGGEMNKVWTAEERTKEPVDREDNCGRCGKKVTRNQNALACEMCSMWYHATCEKVNKEEYGMIRKMENKVVWYCRDCKSRTENIISHYKVIEKENQLLKDENKELKERVTNIEREISNMKRAIKQEIKDEIMEDVRHITEGVAEEVKKIMKGDTIMEKNMQELEKIIEEKEDRRKRANNLVLYRAPESEEEDVSKRIEHDRGIVKELFERALGVQDCTVMRMIRLGKRRDGQDRPLLLEMSNEREKWIIIKNAKNLKGETDNVMKKIGISRDMSKEERDRDRNLREELKEKRQNGEEGWYIRDGKLQRGRN